MPRIFVEPLAIAVTRPPEVTEATPGLSLVQLVVCGAMMLSCASKAVSWSVAASPRLAKRRLDGTGTSRAPRCWTTTPAVPVTPRLLAVTVTGPVDAWATARPVVSTETAGPGELQETRACGTTVPPESRTTALSCAVSLRLVRVTLFGVTVTEAYAKRTVRVSETLAVKSPAAAVT